MSVSHLTLKACTKCCVVKPLDDFHNSKKDPSGKKYCCKKCTTDAAVLWQKENHTRLRETRSRYARSEQGKAKKREWAAISKERNPEVFAAYNRVNTAKQNGSIIRRPCEKCGAEPAEGHHDDYTKPLEVRWLCHKHHNEYHGRETYV